jgi:hypothetical protein
MLGLNNKTYLGTVEDINDPLKIGRCKIRISFLFDAIPVNMLPWSYPAYNPVFGKGGHCGSISVPKKGSVVRVRFNNGDLYSPIYDSLQELASDVKTQLKKEYDGTHILLFDGDADLQIYYTKTKGITIKLKGSYINIGIDKIITIEHADSQSMIELAGNVITINSDSEINSTAVTRIKDTSKEVWIDGKSTKLGSNPQYSAVLGEPLFLILKSLATAIDAKQYPSPGVNAALVESVRKFVLSNTVTISH